MHHLSLHLSHRLNHNEARSWCLSCLINDGGNGFGNFGSDRRCVVEKNPISFADPSESTFTTEAVVLFFTRKCNLNARAKSTQLRLTRTDSKRGLVRLGLLGFGSWDEFRGSCCLGLAWFCWGLSCGSCCLSLETVRVDHDFEWSCCLGLETERVVLIGNEWESSGSTMKESEIIICFFFSFSLVFL